MMLQYRTLSFESKDKFHKMKTTHCSSRKHKHGHVKNVRQPHVTGTLYIMKNRKAMDVKNIWPPHVIISWIYRYQNQLEK